jgi:hypothetical protein
MRSVSVIVPTYNRQSLHPQLYSVFCSQTYPNKDLWVYDDSREPSQYMLAMDQNDPRVHYLWSPDRISIGEKRNALVATSPGDVIAHFDDDDLYLPNFLTTMMARLIDYDLAKLTVWDSVSAFDKSRWRWDTRQHGGSCYAVTGSGPARRVVDFMPDRSALETALLGYGFSYVYPRSSWEKCGGFPDINASEDLVFIRALARCGGRIALIPDCPHLVLHTLHRQSTSNIFPQKKLWGPVDTALMVDADESAPKGFWGRLSGHLWGGSFAFSAGKTYRVTALVKNNHPAREIANRAAAYGVVTSYIDPASDRGAPRPGYRYVETVIRVTVPGSTPRKVPAPFSAMDKSEIITVTAL